eukprot:364999-Chlamydomonas_euryale.AAC.27
MRPSLAPITALAGSAVPALQARVRLETYHANVESVLGFYKDVTFEVDGAQSMGTVFDNISLVIDAVRAGKDPLEAFCQEVPEADECRVYE